MTHWAIYGHNALVTYPVDWLQDKIIGGGLKMAEGAREYAKNEYDHEQYQRHSSKEMMPEDVEQLNYGIKKMQATGKLIEGVADQAEGYTTLQSLFMGGLEGPMTQSAKSRATKRFNSMIKNILSNPESSADDIVANFTEAGYRASVTELRSEKVNK